VVDHFRGRIHFVQCGEAGHWHPPLQGVINLVGRTNLRDFVRLMYHAEGVVCPVTLAMHLAAAVETPSGDRGTRPCVVIAGGREPAHWEAYPNHQYLSTNGALACCRNGGCWKSRCQLVGDGDAKDRQELCRQPVQVTPELRIPRCLDMITPADVIRRIELYYEGGALACPAVIRTESVAATIPPRAGHSTAVHVSNVPFAEPAPIPAQPTLPTSTRKVLLTFRHGLGDAVQLTIVLKHLRQYRPEWHVDVAALVGKHSAYHGLCRNVAVLDGQPTPTVGYDEVFALDWHECRAAHADYPSTKPARCLSEVFGLTPTAALFRYEVQRGERATQLAHRYLQAICRRGPDADGRFPAVLIHYQGNTSGARRLRSNPALRRRSGHSGLGPAFAAGGRHSHPQPGRGP
jgi:hypothetical protein